MSKFDELADIARELAQTEGTWSDISNALFDPDDGLIALAFPAEEDRKRFLASQQYQAIRGLLRDAMKQSGLVAGATPSRARRSQLESTGDLQTRGADAGR